MEISNQPALNFSRKNPLNRDHTCLQSNDVRGSLSQKDTFNTISHGVGAEAILVMKPLQFAAIAIGGLTLGVAAALKSSYKKVTTYTLNRVQKVVGADEAAKLSQEFKKLNWAPEKALNKAMLTDAKAAPVAAKPVA